MLLLFFGWETGVGKGILICFKWGTVKVAEFIENQKK